MMNIRNAIPILIVVVCCWNSGTAQDHDSLFLASAMEKLKNSKAYTLKVVDLMPEEKYPFRPTEDVMNFAEQLIHMSYNLGWLSSSYLSTGKNPVSRESANLQDKALVREVVIRTYDYAIKVLRGFPSRQLGEEVEFFAGPMTKLQIINLLNDHQTHHRGQLMIYLRLCGITPPKYVGW